MKSSASLVSKSLKKNALFIFLVVTLVGCMLEEDIAVYLCIPRCINPYNNNSPYSVNVNVHVNWHRDDNFMFYLLCFSMHKNDELQYNGIFM